MDRQEWLLAALRRYEAPLVRYAARITGDLEKARDVVQETFLKLWKVKRADVEPRLAPWLFTVCRNQALDIRRKERRMESVGSEADLPPADSSGVSLEGRERQSRMLAALATLPEKQREVIRLKFQENLSFKDIGKITGLSVSNVGYLIHVGVKTMRESMVAEDDAPARRGGGAR